MKYLIGFIACIMLLEVNFCQAGTVCKNDTLNQINSDDLISDFKYFRSLLEKSHPSLYRFTPKDSLDKYFDNTLKMLNHPMNEIQYWELLQRLVINIRSGHTTLLLSKKLLDNYDNSYHEILPFSIYISANKIYIKSYIGKPDSSFRINDQVLAIDGETKDQILLHLKGLISGDGHTITFKDYELEAGFFNKLYNLTFARKNQYKIVFKTFEGIKTKTIYPVRAKIYSSGENLIKSPVNESYCANYGNENAVNGFVLSYPDDLTSTALIKITDFNYNEYKALHKKSFKELTKKNIKNLIIDLRDNGGGNDLVCIDLLKYLIAPKFYFSRMDEGVVNIQDFENLFNTNDDSRQVNLNSIDHERYIKLFPANRLQESYTNTFKGKIYIIINGGTFSAATLFAVALKTQLDCKILGLETGGGKAGCDGGAIMHIILPKTKLQLILPLLYTYSANTEKDLGRGLRPDYLILPSAWEFSYQRSIKDFIIKDNQAANNK